MIIMLLEGPAQLMAVPFNFVFFFSSRRRHTRLQGDWSSDVCSSDLQSFCCCQLQLILIVWCICFHMKGIEIGRASCRERVYITVVVVLLDKKKIIILEFN